GVIFVNTINVIGKIHLTPSQRERLLALGAGYIADSNPVDPEKNILIERIGDASVILNNVSTPLNCEVLRACPNIRFIRL
ncbi:MAG: hypothetical protein JXA66_07595, partial [Oligoflexia bacterium]|nr:hypothetical protein [Oligoflexia bacterium]